MPKPIESIRKVFGPTWEPAPAFTPELQGKGVYGAVRVKGTPKVYTIGPGGKPIGSPEEYRGLFGTLEQKGIVGEVSPEQAYSLGIRGPEAKAPAIGTSDLAEAGEREDEEERLKKVEDQDKEAADLQQKLTIEQTKQALADLGYDFPDTAPPKPPLPAFQSTAKSLMAEQGIEQLSSDINDIKAKERELEERYKRGIEESEERLAPLGVVGAEQTEIEKRYRRQAAELRLQKQTLIDEYNTKIGLVEATMEYKAMDYAAATDDYNTSFSNALKLLDITRGIMAEEKDDAEAKKDSARANLDVITKMMSETGKTWDELEPEMQANIRSLEIKGELPSGITQAIYENINTAKEESFHIVSKDKSQVSIHYTDGTTEIFSTGLAPEGEGTEAPKFKFSSSDVGELLSAGFTKGEINTIQSDIIGGVSVDQIKKSIQGDTDLDDKEKSRRIAALTEVLGGEVEYITKESIGSFFSDESLLKYATKKDKDRFVETGGGIWKKNRLKNKDDLLNYIMSRVEEYRTMGLSEDKIFDKIQKAILEGKE